MISKNRMGISRRALMRGIALSGAIAVFVGGKAYAINDLLAQWTFETTLPSTAGPFAPETGSGSATGLHAGSSTYAARQATDQPTRLAPMFGLLVTITNCRQALRERPLLESNLTR